MKKITVMDEKIFCVYKAFDHKRYQWYKFEDFSHTHIFRKKAVSTERKTLKTKFCLKKSTLPVKKLK